MGSDFNKGDILLGKERGFDKAYHPIIYIGGSTETPLAVILTHSSNFPCNIPLVGSYDEKQSYFVGHLIQKISLWGPYNKVGEITKEDLQIIEKHISELTPITWEQYEEYSKDYCPIHGSLTA